MGRMPLNRWWSVILPGLAPVVAVLALKFFASGAGPQSAGAAVAHLDSPSKQKVRPVVAPGSEAAARYADLLQYEPGLASPFAVPDVAPEPIAAVPAARPAERREDPRPELKVTAIAGGREVMAVVNGKVRRPGEAVASGWAVEAIDADAGTVTFRHAELGVVTVTLRQGAAAK